MRKQLQTLQECRNEGQEMLVLPSDLPTSQADAPSCPNRWRSIPRSGHQPTLVTLLLLSDLPRVRCLCREVDLLTQDAATLAVRYCLRSKHSHGRDVVCLHWAESSNMPFPNINPSQFQLEVEVVGSALINDSEIFAKLHLHLAMVVCQTGW